MLTGTDRLPQEVPAALPVFRTQEPDAFPSAAARVMSVAAAVGLRVESYDLCYSPDWVHYREGQHELSIHGRSGALRFRHHRRDRRRPRQRFALTEPDVGRVAAEFLERSTIAPLTEARQERVAYLRMSGTNLDGTPVEEEVLDAGVVYRREFEGVQVDGPGGWTMVNVGAEADVVGFRTLWRPVQAVASEVTIHPPERALEAFTRLANRKRGDVHVVRASFGYFELGPTDLQVYLQPAYTIVYDVVDGPVRFRSAFVAHAGTRVFERLLGEKRFRRARMKPRPATALDGSAVTGPTPRPDVRQEGQELS